MAKREVLLDAVHIRGMDSGGAGQASAPLRVLGLQQVPFTGTCAQDLAVGGNFEPLGGGFFRFNALRTTHNQCFFPKRAGTIRGCCYSSKGFLSDFSGSNRPPPARTR